MCISHAMPSIPLVSRALGALRVEPPLRLCSGLPWQSVGVRRRPRRFFGACCGHARILSWCCAISCSSVARSSSRWSHAVLSSCYHSLSWFIGGWGWDFCIRHSPTPIGRTWGSPVPPMMGTVIGTHDVSFRVTSQRVSSTMSTMKQSHDGW
jgi:hypothetical protein